MSSGAHDRIESLVLSPYRLTVHEFAKTGVKRFTPEVFAHLHTEIGNVRLNYGFLVFGFDEQSRPHVFEVEDRGVVRDRGSLGLWAIGSGAAAAINTMLFHEYSIGLPLRTAAYYACAGKFMAERAGLSQDTRAHCLMNDGRLIALDTREVREVWEKSGRPRIPKNLWNRLPPFFGIVGNLKRSDDQPPDSEIQVEPPTRILPKRGQKSRRPSRG